MKLYQAYKTETQATVYTNAFDGCIRSKARITL